MIVIQRSDDGGETWMDWDTTETVDRAIGTVKQYAISTKGAAFRVVECLFGGSTVEFQWGPFEAIQVTD